MNEELLTKNGKDAGLNHENTTKNPQLFIFIFSHVMRIFFRMYACIDK